MVFSFDDGVKTVAKLKVIGVGGAGGNAINRMVDSGLEGVEFIAVNTDAMALEHNRADIKIQIGSKLTGGLGAGANPLVGMESMLEDRERVRAQLEGADMVFIAAGMGGGTGTGAAPVVADIAREMGVLTVAVVTKPFLFEGYVREKNAAAGLEALRKSVDTVIVVPNQKLLSVVNKSTSMVEAFTMADDILNSATRGISEIILKHGNIQVDFADVRAIMSQGGDALMGTGRASGENRATIAADRAIHSPLLDNISIAGATGVLVNISGANLGILEVQDAMNFIYEAIGTDTHSNIIFGTVLNPELNDEIAITVIATGFAQTNLPKQFGSTKQVALDLTPKRVVPVQPAAPTYFSTPEAKSKVAESIKEPVLDRTPVAPVERIAAFQDRGDRNEKNDRPKPVEESPQARPFVKPVSKGGFNPIPAIPRDDENRVLFNDASDTRKFGIGAGQSAQSQKGRYKDMDPDIDYETPAFLRNQAD